MNTLHTKFLLLLLSLLMIRFANAQLDSVTYYLDRNERLCAKENAVYLVNGKLENDKFRLSHYVIASGKLIIETTYADYTLAVKDGPYALYHEETQQPMEKGNYAKNKKEGYWLRWTNGLLTDSTLYEADKDISITTISYNDSGLVRSRVTNDSRTKTSEMSYYDDLGQLERYAKWIQGTGDQVYYYSDGKQKSIETYKSGKLVATKHFKPDGSEISEREFRKEQEKMLAELKKQAEEKNLSFPGGSAGFRSYFEKNFRAPGHVSDGVRNMIQVSITFYLDKDGHAYDITVEPSTDLDLKQAVEDVFKKMPAWNMKGRQGYGPVRYNISLSRT